MSVINDPSLGSITCHVLKQGVPPTSGFHSRPCSMLSGVWHHAARGHGNLANSQQARPTRVCHRERHSG
jgi:hypothetical protein